jgi:ferrochelatase
MTKTKGVVLLQFGGPDSLDAVEPFLYNLFCDHDIVQFPGGKLTQKLFAKAISKLRYKKLQEKYAEIGGKSPIVDKTIGQQRALQKLFDQKFGIGAISVELGMRYWKPFTDSAIKSLLKKQISDIILLPLYPQYSITNAGSCYNEWDRQSKKLRASFNENRIVQYHTHPLYIKALQERIEQALAKFSDTKDVYILFSGHGTPLDIVERGDPYSLQIIETMNLVMEKFKDDFPHSLSWQSKVGPKKWLEPDTEETVEELAKRGKKKLLLVPISFVSDHIETSHELNIEAREEAEKLGVEEFIVSEGLNDSPLFIGALADIAIRELDKFV